jgi:CRP/FNR family cyclic AMP-dependent transcriptional regulator
MDVVEALGNTELFAEATHEELGAIVPAVRRRAFARGAYVYHAGEPAAAAYVVLTGLLKTVTVGPAGHELIVELTGPGGCIGEFHLLEEDSRRYYDLVAVERSECLVVSRVSLQYYLERNPRLMRKVAAAIVRRLLRQAATHHIAPRTESDIAGRVERQLSALSDAYGEDTAGGRRIRLGLDQSALAALVGASRPNVNRALRRLVRTGVISYDAGQITVLNGEALRGSLSPAPRRRESMATRRRPR